MKYTGIGLCLAGLLALLPAISQAQSSGSVDILIAAMESNDPGYEGLYKYTITGNWDLGDGGAISYILFSLGDECPCLCDTALSTIVFPNPGGTATGETIRGRECQARFAGFIECGGLLETDDVVAKYESVGSSCEARGEGMGSWYFYSTMPPLPWAEYPGAVIVKYGDDACSGDLQGELPNCLDCLQVSTRESSWGAIKSLYR